VSFDIKLKIIMVANEQSKLKFQIFTTIKLFAT